MMPLSVCSVTEMAHKSMGIREIVDAQPTMDYVRALFAKGMPVQSMADQSGLNTRTILGFINGYIATGRDYRRPVKRCTAETRAKVFALKFVPAWKPDGFRPDLLRGLRESKGLSRMALAKASGLCTETLQYWETGRSLPSRKNNIDTVLRVLGAEWEDVSGAKTTREVPADEYSMIFSEGVIDQDADYTPSYPCHVCRATFQSLLTLRTHPHPKKVKVSA